MIPRIHLLLWPILLLLLASRLQASPFPVKGPIFDGAGEPWGEAQVYPRYVEIFDLENQKKVRVGIMVETGLAKIFATDNDAPPELVGYASGGLIYDAADNVRGHYFWTPTWSFVYDLQGKRAGSVKCIAWPRVCIVGVGAYLLGLKAVVPPEPPAKVQP